MYGSIDGLILRLGYDEVVLLTHGSDHEEQINEKVANSALQDGQALVDSYIGQRVTLPLAENNISQFVKTLTTDIAIYYLYRRVASGVGDEHPTVKLYNDAIKHLERFAKGETSLGLVIPTEQQASHHAEITSQPRRCTRQSLGELT